MESKAIINTMEILETRPINELVSECVIKVCWVSDDQPNANHTLISKEIGKQIASTLPGAPVVGFFDKDTNDFVEHSRLISIENGTLKIEELTKPYGFVSLSDQPWYQDFTENGVQRTYLMCKAYLWTKQYEESQLAFNKGQSMELDEKTMAGYYEGDVFVFTSATMSKLCILGDDYAPCFDGAKVMSTYLKGYTDLAEELEKTIGAHYYVANDKMVEKEIEEEKGETTYTLSLQRMKDDVSTFLGAEYYVIGIFISNGQYFAIAENYGEGGGFIKVNITVISEATGQIQCSNNLIPVSMEWTEISPEVKTTVEPMNGDSIDTEQEIPMNVSATFAEEEAPVVFTSESLEEKVEIPDISSYLSEIEGLKTKLQDLNQLIDTYQQKEKKEIIDKYSKILDEINTEELVQLSLQEIETKLALQYAAQTFSAIEELPAQEPIQIQVDVSTIKAQELNLPEFIKTALEIDKAQSLKI